MTRFVPFAALALATLAAPAFAQDKPAGLDFQAFAQTARDRLMALDTDKDGKISKDEFAARARQGRGGKMGGRMFDRFDTNKDGFLDKGEIDAMLARRFARTDANHDGVLTADERQAMRGAAARPGQ